VVFNSNTKVSIFAIHHKVSIFFNSTNIIPKFPYCPYFLFFIFTFYKKKKIKFRGAKIAKGVVTATMHFFYNFFIKNKKKNLGAIWEVLDTIGQIAKI
jgi:hypothetical protein